MSKRLKFTLFSTTLLFLFYHVNQATGTVPLYPKITVSIKGEPKLNQPFELKVSVANVAILAHSKEFKEPLSFQLHFDWKKEIPRHIKVLSGGTQWKMMATQTHTIRMQITEVSENRMDVFSKWVRSTEFVIFTTATRGAMIDWSGAEDHRLEASFREEIGKERHKNVVEFYSLTFYFDPSGKGKIWTQKDQKGKPWIKEFSYKEMGSPDMELYLPLIFGKYYAGADSLKEITRVFTKSYEVFIEGHFSESLSLLKKLSTFQLPPDIEAVYHNNLGVLNLVLGKGQEGISHIKRAAEILKASFATIQTKHKALREKLCLYRERTSKGNLYCWEKKHYPHEELHLLIYQNLAVVYILEGKYEEGMKMLHKSKIKRALSGSYQQDYEEVFNKLSARFKKVKGIKYNIIK